jgi:hypothetical protein
MLRTSKSFRASSAVIYGAQNIIKHGIKYTPQKPVFRKTRSWRGIMQVRYNDELNDAKIVTKQLLFWAPLRVILPALCVFAAYYVMMGHDVFLQDIMGFESESHYEPPIGDRKDGLRRRPPMITGAKAHLSPVRDLEKPLHPIPEFDIFKEGVQK